MLEEIQEGVSHCTSSISSPLAYTGTRILCSLCAVTGKCQVPIHSEVGGLRTAHIRTSISRYTSKLVYLMVTLISFFSSITALINSGATLNFIHERLVESLGLETTICNSVCILLADGRVLAHSNRQVTLKFTTAGVLQTQTFLVMPIGIHDIILGMPWLERINPAINWRLKTVNCLADLPPGTVEVPPPEPKSSTESSIPSEYSAPTESDSPIKPNPSPPNSPSSKKTKS